MIPLFEQNASLRLSQSHTSPYVDDSSYPIHRHLNANKHKKRRASQPHIYEPVSIGFDSPSNSQSQRQVNESRMKKHKKTKKIYKRRRHSLAATCSHSGSKHHLLNEHYIPTLDANKSSLTIIYNGNNTNNITTNYLHHPTAPIADAKTRKTSISRRKSASNTSHRNANRRKDQIQRFKSPNHSYKQYDDEDEECKLSEPKYTDQDVLSLDDDESEASNKKILRIRKDQI